MRQAPRPPHSGSTPPRSSPSTASSRSTGSSPTFGPCYRSRAWAAALALTGTAHKRTRPYTPNGKVERFNATLAREWAYVREYASEAQRLAALADFLNHYNHERPHAALRGQSPISRTQGSTYRITAGQAPDPTDLFPVQLTLDFDFE
jgi:transposase InsO family protein